MGSGRSRFSSPRNRFRLLYLAQDPMTAIAETIVRDRYEKNAERLLHEEDLDRYSVAVVRNAQPLLLLDLRNEGASLLGVSTDAVRAKSQAGGRGLSQLVYDETTFDGFAYMSRITNRECAAVYDRAVATKTRGRQSGRRPAAARESFGDPGRSPYHPHPKCLARI